MASRPDQCDPKRLRLSMEDRLSEAEQGEVAAHLESCQACCQELEQMAAASRFWGDAQLLRGEPVPDAIPTIGLVSRAAGDHDHGDEDDDHGDSWLEFLDPPDPDQPDTLGRIGPYQVLEILGRGGMGVVLKARDPALDRTVAIKILTPALGHGATSRRRFNREARAAAAVGHEHIVAIYAVDEFRGLPYLVMQYVPGRSLQERLDASGPLEVKEILRIGTQAARALAAAHAQGVVHRDIKPANILLENCIEKVKLTDFGLARAIDDASLTQSGVIAGTPQYMAPEQAQGNAVDARADLFALGLVLYAMAAGRPPFRADSAMAVLKRVCENPHRPIRQLNPDVPDWLEASIDRLLAKDPDDRFQTATEVADLLERGLAHLQQPTTVARPIVPVVSSAHAHPLEFDLPAAKPARRPRRRLALAAGFALLAMAGLGASEATGITQVSEYVATILRIKTPEGTLVVKCDDPGVKVQIDDEVLIIGGAGPQEIRLKTGRHRVQAIKDGHPVRDELVSIMRGKKEIVNVSLEPTTVTVAENKSPAPMMAPPSHVEQCMVCHTNNQNINFNKPLPPSHPPLYTWNNQFVESPRPWVAKAPANPARARGLVWSLAFSPDGKRLAIGQQGIDNRPSFLRVWDLAERSDVIWMMHPAAYRSVAFSPDGRFLAAGTFDGVLTLMGMEGEVARGRSQNNQGSPINALVFLRDGNTVAAGDWDGAIKFWNVVTSIDRAPLQYPDRVYALAVSPDGSTLAVAGKKDVILIYDLATSRLKATLSGHTHAIESLDFSPDGKLLASAGGYTVRLWNTETWKIEGGHIHHNPEILCVRFSPDGSRLAISDGEGGFPQDKTLEAQIIVCDVKTQAEVARLKGHTNSIYALAFSPDGKTLASGSMDQTVKLWDTATGALRETIVPGESGTSSGMGAVSLGGASAMEAKRLPSFDDHPAKPVDPTIPHPKAVIPPGQNIEAWSAAYSPDGKILITATSGGLMLWDVAKFPGGGQPLSGQFSGVNKIVFAPDGKMFATANWDRTIVLFDADGNQLATLKGHTDGVRSVAFSPDGQLLASASWDKTVKIWDMVSLREIRTLPAQDLPVNAVAFSPDGKTLASGNGDWRTEMPGEVELWDPASGKHIRNAWHAIREVKDLAYSPDGKYLALAHAGSRIAGGDGAVVCLSLRPGDETTRTIKCPGGASTVAFSPDGTLLAVGSTIGRVQIVEPAFLNVIATLGLQHDNAMVFDAAFSPDGKSLATASKNGTVRIWPIGDLGRNRTATHNAASR